MTNRPTRDPKWADDATWTSGPNSGNPVKVQPTDGARAQGFVGGETFKSTYVNDELNLRTQWIRYFDDMLVGHYGDGVLGNVTYAVNSTLAADLYAENLTINAGVHLDTGGFRIFVRDTLTMNANAKIHRNGNTATTEVGASALASGTLLGAANGGGGGDGPMDAGASGANAAKSLGGSGGAGGDADSGGVAGGAGGSSSPPTNEEGAAPRTVTHVISGACQGLSGGAVVHTAIRGGAGGGGGGSNSGTGGHGGGGGGGGGVVMVAARRISGTDANIEAKGGGGADGTTTDTGGGGGGGGGVILLVTRETSLGISLVVSGGAGGTGTSGGGEDGTDGADGLVITVRV